MNIELPGKKRFYISEAARISANFLHITERAARVRLYRQIDDGKIRAIYYLGVMMIEKKELRKALNGESKWGY